MGMCNPWNHKKYKKVTFKGFEDDDPFKVNFENERKKALGRGNKMGMKLDTFKEACLMFAGMCAIICVLVGFLMLVGSSLSGCTSTKWQKKECNRACLDAGYRHNKKENWRCYCGSKAGMFELELEK